MAVPIQRMVTYPQAADRTPEVFVTKNAVIARKARSQVPKGFRLASPEEIASRYAADTKFQEMLDDSDLWVWSNQVGLASTGPHKIDEGGNFIKITTYQYMRSDPNDRSWHYPGGSRVAFAAYNYGKNGVLYVDATLRPSFTACAAYVAVGGGTQKHVRPSAKLEILARMAEQDGSRPERTAVDSQQGRLLRTT